MIAKFKPASRIALLFSATLIIALCSFTFTRAAEKNANPSSIENPAGKGNANPSAVKPQSTTVATMKALKKQLTEQDEKLKEAQDRLDAMIHKQKDISDFGLDPENSVSTETIRHLEADRITLDSSCRQMELLLAEVQKLSPRDLPKVMDVVYPDQILTSLKEAQALCDRNLAGLRSNFGEEHQEVRHAKSIRDNLEQQINERVSGILRGLAVKIDALKAQRDSATRSLESARERREKTLVSKFRPYLDAQSEVEKLRRDRDAIQFRLVQENLDADLSKAKPGEKITR